MKLCTSKEKHTQYLTLNIVEIVFILFPPKGDNHNTGLPHFNVPHFITLHRCCIFYELKARPATSKKTDSLNCSGVEPNQQYLQSTWVVYEKVPTQKLIGYPFSSYSFVRCLSLPSSTFLTSNHSSSGSNLPSIYLLLWTLHCIPWHYPSSGQQPLKVVIFI